jgi:hypothetical protein
MRRRELVEKMEVLLGASGASLVYAGWLDEQVAPHWPKLRRLGYMLCVALLFGGVALHAFQSGFARTAVATLHHFNIAPSSTLLLASQSNTNAMS